MRSLLLAILVLGAGSATAPHPATNPNTVPQAQVLDVETHRAPIDDVIADIYETWQRDGHAGALSPVSI